MASPAVVSTTIAEDSVPEQLLENSVSALAKHRAWHPGDRLRAGLFALREVGPQQLASKFAEILRGVGSPPLTAARGTKVHTSKTKITYDSEAE